MIFAATHNIVLFLLLLLLLCWCAAVDTDVHQPNSSLPFSHSLYPLPCRQWELIDFGRRGHHLNQ